MSIRVIVNGASGRMGSTAVTAIRQADNLTLVGQLDHTDNLQAAITEHQADVVVDFTLASVVFENVSTIINTGARPVVGTSGLLPEQIMTLQQACKAKRLGGLIAPNFSISAVLMMQFAKQAAHYHQDVEIIEMHHAGKEESPSGTAIKTAEMLSEVYDNKAAIDRTHELYSGARGADYKHIPIHAIRLPGVVAAQQVVFGGQGETLTIQHNTINRECFMPGMLLACEKVMGLEELVYGLEYVL